MTTINIFAAGAMSSVYGDKWCAQVDRPRCTAGRKGSTPNERRHRAVEQVMKKREYLTLQWCNVITSAG